MDTKTKRLQFIIAINVPQMVGPLGYVLPSFLACDLVLTQPLQDEGSLTTPERFLFQQQGCGQ